MSEEPTTTPAPELEAANTPADITIIQNTYEKFLGATNINVVYGEGVKHGDIIIVPAAEVVSVIGFGLGYGTTSDNTTGGGGGGGGRVLSRPVALVVASPRGVRVKPILDVTKIAIAALTTTGLVLAMILGRSLRPFPRSRSAK